MRHLGRMPISFGLKMIAQALEERRKEAARKEWLAFLPWMTGDNFKSFDQYYAEKLHHAKLSTSPRSREMILAEAEAIRRAIKQ